MTLYFYYAMTDRNGVLCVEQLDTCGREDNPWTEAEAASLADTFTKVIYFRIKGK